MFGGPGLRVARRAGAVFAGNVCAMAACIDASDGPGRADDPHAVRPVSAAAWCCAIGRRDVNEQPMVVRGDPTGRTT
jgi:hypothetical protein